MMLSFLHSGELRSEVRSGLHGSDVGHPLHVLGAGVAGLSAIATAHSLGCKAILAN